MRAHHRLCSSGVEHFLGKEEAIGSIPITGSIFTTRGSPRFSTAEIPPSWFVFLGVMSASDARKEAEHRGSGLRAVTEGAGAPDAANVVLISPG